MENRRIIITSRIYKKDLLKSSYFAVSQTHTDIFSKSNIIYVHRLTPAIIQSLNRVYPNHKFIMMNPNDKIDTVNDEVYLLLSEKVSMINQNVDAQNRIKLHLALNHWDFYTQYIYIYPLYFC